MGDAEDAAFARFLGVERLLLNSKAWTALVPQECVGVKPQNYGHNARAVLLSVLVTGKRKADGAGFFLRRVAPVPAMQSGQDKRCLWRLAQSRCM